MAITNINGIPFIWDEESDKNLLGSLFPDGNSNSPPQLDSLSNSNNNFYKKTGNYFAQSPLQNKRLSSEEIAVEYQYKKTYDQDKTKVYTNNVQLVSGSEEINKSHEVQIIGKSLEDRFVKIFNEFELVLFANSDGASILHHFELAEPKPNQMILFLEINDKSNYFGSVMRVKLGEKIITADLPFIELFEFTKEHQVNISKNEIQELITTGNIKNKFRYIFRILNKIANPLNYLGGILFEKFGEVFKTAIPTFLEELKIKEERWSPEAKGYHPLFGSRGLELLVQQSQRAGVKPDKHFKVVQNSINGIFDGIEKEIDTFYKFITQYFPNKFNKRFHKTLKTLNIKLKDARSVFNDTDWLSKLLALGTQMFNAYICGIINGFIDAINGILQLIGLICYAIAALNKGASDILFATSMLIEIFENIFEAIIEFDLIGFLWKCVKLPFKFIIGIYKIVKQITEADLKKLLKKLDTSLVKISYVCGNIVGFIIQLLLEALCTGGLAAVEDLIQTLFKFLRNPAESIANGIKGTINVTKEFFSNLLYKLSKFFESLKSKAAFKALDEWVEKMLAAVKKELGLGDDLTELDNIGKNLDGIRLSKLEIEKWADEISKLGGRVRYYTEDKEIIKYFTKKNCGAAFSARTIPPTIWIREGATDLELFHESMHFEDLLRRGQSNYLRGEAEESILPFANKTIPKRDQLISKYIKEKYVLDKIIEEQALWIKKFGKGRWLEEDIEFSTNYFKLRYENKCIEAGIDISKIIIKQ